MEHSEELRDLTIRFYEATTSGDLSFFDRHVSLQEEGVVFVGTDPDEWWEGFDAFREAMRA
jgi:ketosteroid isomerase-like protein